MYYDALLANGDYARLLDALQKDTQVPGRTILAMTQMIRVNAIGGDKIKAQKQIDEALQLYALPNRDTARKSLEAIMCCCAQDVDGYLKSTPDKSFEAAFLRGRLKEAEDLLPASNVDRIAFQGLLYLEASRAGAKERADSLWSALMSELKKGGRDYRLCAEFLEGRQPLATRMPERLPIEPGTKRVLLAIAAERFPEQSRDVLALARRLDFQHDAISLCLAKFLQ